MNLDEYRAMKAQDAGNQGTGVPQTATQQPVETTSPTTQPVTPTETPTPPETTTQETPAKITVNGKEYTPEQIAEFEKGYLRQSDYTKKTQELASNRRQVEEAMQILNAATTDPEVFQKLVQKVPTLDPTIRRATELEHTNYDLMVQNEILTLQQKYPDFDADKAMKLAVDRKLNSLEDAYLLDKVMNPAQPQTLDVNALKNELLASLKAELSPKEVPNTSSIISTNSSGHAPVQDTTPKLNQAQLDVAKKFGMKPEEYAKWRGAPK